MFFESPFFCWHITLLTATVCIFLVVSMSQDDGDQVSHDTHDHGLWKTGKEYVATGSVALLVWTQFDQNDCRLMSTCTVSNSFVIRCVNPSCLTHLSNTMFKKYFIFLKKKENQINCFLCHRFRKGTENKCC